MGIDPVSSDLVHWTGRMAASKNRKKAAWKRPERVGKVRSGSRVTIFVGGLFAGQSPYFSKRLLTYSPHTPKEIKVCLSQLTILLI